MPHIQGLKLYRKLIKRLIKDKIRCSITVGDGVFSLFHPYRYNEHPKLRDPTEPFRERLNNSHDSGYCLVAKRKDKVIGTVTLKKLPENNSSPHRGWWLFGLLVGWRYRGLGIGEKLTKMACEVAVKNAHPSREEVLKTEKQKEKGYLFMDHSEYGKSTVVKAFSDKAKILNDDRIMVTEKKGKLLMYRTS